MSNLRSVILNHFVFPSIHADVHSIELWNMLACFPLEIEIHKKRQSNTNNSSDSSDSASDGYSTISSDSYANKIILAYVFFLKSQQLGQYDELIQYLKEELLLDNILEENTELALQKFHYIKHPVIQYIIARLLQQNGNIALAKNFFILSANQNFERAQAALCAEFKETELRNQYEKSGVQNFYASKVLLAKMYLLLPKEMQNNKEYYDLIHSAAEYRNPEAQYLVSQAYREGIGTDVNLRKAEKWRDKAIKHLYPPAILEKGISCYEDKKNEAHALFSLIPDHPIAQFYLGLMSEQGKAEQLFRKAALQGYNPAKLSLAKILDQKALDAKANGMNNSVIVHLEQTAKRLYCELLQDETFKYDVAQRFLKGFDHADAESKQKDIKKAILLLKNILIKLTLNPDPSPLIPKLLFEIGLAYLKLEEFKEAANYFKRAEINLALVPQTLQQERELKFKELLPDVNDLKIFIDKFLQIIDLPVQTQPTLFLRDAKDQGSFGALNFKLHQMKKELDAKTPNLLGVAEDLKHAVNKYKSLIAQNPAKRDDFLHLMRIERFSDGKISYHEILRAVKNIPVVPDITYSLGSNRRRCCYIL